MSQSSTRKLAARRGSVSAPDPLGKNAVLNYDPNRSSSSTLTIVRVVSDPAGSSSGFVVTPLNLSDLPPSPAHHRRSLRRHGSTSGSSPADNRLSFAFSSFSPLSPPQPPSPHLSSGPQTHSSRTGSSPSSSPRLRPSSPQFTRRNSGSGGSTFSKPNLTPEQLVDLARQSSSPRYVPGASLVSNSTHVDIAATPISPTTFTILPADVYLPFIDRAAETAHLLSTPPTKKLLSLLAQTFQTQMTSQETQDPFTVNPTLWTFATLRRWLTEVDRPSANDAVWVRQARQCVLAHSELIWERLKGALGVPPELEQDMDADPAGTLLSAPEQDDIKEAANYSPPLSSSPEQSVMIEPILATSSSIHPPSAPGVSHPPPSSLPAGLSQSASKSHGDLQDIVEDGEEEEESGAHTGDDDCTNLKPEDDSEAQIHGLRVCTSPVPPSSVTPHVLSYPPSPTMSMNLSGRNSAEPRSPDFPQLPLTRRPSRTSSHGSVSSLGRPSAYVYRDFGNNSTSEIGDSESERAYDPAGDRVPGNPLFPSNFSRLALGPTLRANNPSLRSSHAATPRWTRWAPGSRPPSWLEGWDTVKQEYATSVASGSSIGAGDTE